MNETRLRDEAAKYKERYETYKDSSDDWLRRKVHHDLDRFLMEHREVAIKLMTEGLAKAKTTKKRWWKTRP